MTTTEREAAINALSDEIIARAKAEIETTDEFCALSTNAQCDAMIFDFALELQRLEEIVREEAA